MAQLCSGGIDSYPTPTDLDTKTALQQFSNWINVPSLFRNTELDLTTNNPLPVYDYQYEVYHVSDVKELIGYGEILYYNTVMQDCSVSSITITEYLSPNPVYLPKQVPQCNGR